MSAGKKFVIPAEAERRAGIARRKEHLILRAIPDTTLRPFRDDDLKMGWGP